MDTAPDYGLVADQARSGDSEDRVVHTNAAAKAVDCLVGEETSLVELNILFFDQVVLRPREYIPSKIITMILDNVKMLFTIRFKIVEIKLR